MVNISRLPSAQKNAVWHHIKNNHPELAELLSDDCVKQILTQFSGSTIKVSRDKLPENFKNAEY